jgi:primosomal protein N' (replication factor Y)
VDIIKVAIPVPLRRFFDYALPEDIPIDTIKPGMRVLVPFGTKQRVGIVCGPQDTVDYDPSKIKAIIALIDTTPVFDDHIYQLLNWAADYYQHPIGDVYQSALPKLLRENRTIDDLIPDCYEITNKGIDWDPAQLRKAVKQQSALNLFKAHIQLDKSQIKAHGIASATIKAMLDKKFIDTTKPEFKPFDYSEANKIDAEKPLKLNVEQAVAVTAINNHLDRFYPTLIEGVTGSGKTEVYLQNIEEVLQKNRQVLVLVPEIGLTPQTLARFKNRFKVRIDIWHSALNNTERFDTWLNAGRGTSAIVIGTRSSIFLPFRDLGLIVIDEEHDSSFKQQDTFRYNARDMAIYRSRMLDIPIVLGTATPSLETLKNALDKRYHSFTLAGRISGHQHKYNVIDIKALHLQSGMSQPMIKRIDHHLKQHNQVMLFLNRRGYAPAILCHECGWMCECKRCSAFYTLHKANNQLICHHCGSQSRIPHQCVDCGSTNVQSAGQGTEQLEERLSELFPDITISRLDRDSTRRKGSFEKTVDEINQPGRRIIIGTQMIAKGHHFPNVTLVAILDVDGALFSADFRASEKLAQLLIQVSGRAGRGSQSGEIALQTHFPGHPLLQDLINNGYGHLSRYLLKERNDAILPPFVSQLMFRSHAPFPALPRDFLAQVRDLLSPYQPHIELLGPLPAPMEKKAGNYRYQLLVQSRKKGMLQSILKLVLPQIDKLKLSHKVRWSLDIDPMDMN